MCHEVGFQIVRSRPVGATHDEEVTMKERKHFEWAIVFGVIAALVGVGLAMAESPARAPLQSGAPTAVSYQGHVMINGSS